MRNCGENLMKFFNGLVVAERLMENPENNINYSTWKRLHSGKFYEPLFNKCNNTLLFRCFKFKFHKYCFDIILNEEMHYPYARSEFLERVYHMKKYNSSTFKAIAINKIPSKDWMPDNIDYFIQDISYGDLKIFKNIIVKCLDN